MSHSMYFAFFFPSINPRLNQKNNGFCIPRNNIGSLVSIDLFVENWQTTFYVTPFVSVCNISFLLKNNQLFVCIWGAIRVTVATTNIQIIFFFICIISKIKFHIRQTEKDEEIEEKKTTLHSINEKNIARRHKWTVHFLKFCILICFQLQFAIC